MSGLVVRDKNGENISYSGSQFEGLGDVGALHLHVRTGSGPDDVVKYALTSKPLDDKYKALRMRIPDGASGKEAYIAQQYVDVRTVTTEEEYTSTRSSEYTTTEREDIASTTKSSTTTATRSATCDPIYYGVAPTRITSSYYKFTAFYPGEGTEVYVDDFENMVSSIRQCYDDTGYILTEMFDGKVANASASTASIIWELDNSCPYELGSRRGSVTETYSYSNNLCKETKLLPAYVVTETRTSSASNYTTTTHVDVASKTSSHTTTSSGSEEYTSTRVTETTEAYITNNADL